MAESRPRLISWRDVIVFVVLAVPVFWLVGLIDKSVYDYCGGSVSDNRDWVRFLRVMGFLPTWLAAACALWLMDRTPRRPLLLVGAVVFSGLMGEGLKLVIRRERPSTGGGAHVYASWHDFVFSSAGLSTPSSHAIVAFGAAWMLCRLFPRATPVWLALATGCAVTRVLQGAHFVSDVYLSAVVSCAVITILWRWSEQQTARLGTGV